jgi:predicted enzyme related to lactoylglutathione lyase
MSQVSKKFPKPQEGLQCWIEIPAKDLQKLKQFYADAFPNWTWPGGESDESVLRFDTGKRELV